MAFEKNKFSLTETLNNNNGKTSGTGLMGMLLISTGCICFIICMVGWFLKLPETTSVMNNVIMLIVIGGGLLGVRKVMDKNPVVGSIDTSIIEQKQPEQNPNIG